jgi:phage gp36-like protein
MMAYLSQAEYLERFDEQETIDLTDPEGNAIDPDELAAAMEAGQSVADAYIGKRYTIPLSSPPTLVKDIVADLARERLHTLHPTDEVTARADRARAMLRDIAKGVMELPTATGIVEESASDIPAVSAPEAIFSNTVLGSYQGRMRTLQ